MDFKEEVDIGGCRGFSHCGTFYLQPKRVPKLEYVVFHDDGEGFREGGGGDAGESIFSLMDVSGDLEEGHRGIDVHVHRRSISGEQASSWG